MKNFKKAFALLLALAMVFTMVACAKQPAADDTTTPDAPAADEKIRIVVVSKNLADNFFLNYQYPAEDKAAELGIEFEWVAPAENVVEDQVKMFESVVATKPDAIFFAPIDPEGAVDLINDAVAQGITVATFDSDSPDSDRAFFIGCSGYDLGYQCGEAMVKALPDGGNVAVVLGQAGIPVLEDRKAGFEAAIKDHNITVRDTLVYDLSSATIATVEAIEQYISAYGSEINGLYCVAGWQCYADVGSMPYTKAWADNGGSFINIDTSYESINFIKEGICKVHIAQNTAGASNNSLEILYRMAKGEELAAVVSDLGLTLDEGNNIWLDGIYVDADNCDAIRETLPEGF